MVSLKSLFSRRAAAGPRSASPPLSIAPSETPTAVNHRDDFEFAGEDFDAHKPKCPAPSEIGQRVEFCLSDVPGIKERYPDIPRRRVVVVDGRDGISVKGPTPMFDALGAAGGKGSADEEESDTEKNTEEEEEEHKPAAEGEDKADTEELTVVVKSLTGKTNTMTVPTFTTVLMLKMLVRHKEGVPVGQQRIFHGGKQLEGHYDTPIHGPEPERYDHFSDTLVNRGVRDGDVIHLVLRLC